MKDKYISQWEDQYSEQMNVRRDKRSKLQEAGSHPYKHGVKPSIKATKLKEMYDHKEK